MEPPWQRSNLHGLMSPILRPGTCVLALACAVAAAAWLSPQVIGQLRLDRHPRAVRQRAQVAASADNDIAAIIAAAPQTTLRRAARWFVSGDWINVKGGGPRWRPLVSCFWWLEYRLFETDFVLYNLLTVALVAVSCALLAAVVAGLSRSLPAGALAAGFVLWKVTGEIGRVLLEFPIQMDVLAGICILTSLCLLIAAVNARARRPGALIGCSIVCYVAGVLTKEAVLAFPLAAWALLWLRLRRRAMPWIAAYALVAALLLLVRTWVLGGAGPCLVRFDILHLSARACHALLGFWPIRGTEWPAVGGAILAASVFFVAHWPHLARRRPVAYSLLLGVPALLALAARVTMDTALVLGDWIVWKQLAAPFLLLLSGALVFRWRPAEGVVLGCLLLAASAQLVVGRDIIRPHYYYLPAIAWAALDAVALAAAQDYIRRGVRMIRRHEPGGRKE